MLGEREPAGTRAEVGRTEGGRGARGAVGLVPGDVLDVVGDRVADDCRGLGEEVEPVEPALDVLLVLGRIGSGQDALLPVRGGDGLGERGGGPGEGADARSRGRPRRGPEEEAGAGACRDS